MAEIFSSLLSKITYNNIKIGFEHAENQIHAPFLLKFNFGFKFYIFDKTAPSALILFKNFR